MERVQKKCLIASVATHGLLLALLVVGAAFIKPPQPREIIPIKYFPSRLIGPLVDSPNNGGGGGAPRVIRTTQPPAPNPPAPRNQVEPPAPPPPPTTSSKKKAEVEPPVTVRDHGLLKANKSKTTTDTTDTSSKSKINTKLTTRPNTTDKNSKSKSKDSDDPSSKTNERQTAFKKAVGELGKGLTNGGLAMSDVIGSGLGGGLGAVNYSQAVLGAYDDAWNPPAELTDDSAVAYVKITVNRTGTIVDARIVTRSHNALMDRSVQNALEAVKSLPPFPEGAKDIERVFKIEFNLKVKRGIG